MFQHRRFNFVVGILFLTTSSLALAQSNPDPSNQAPTELSTVIVTATRNPVPVSDVLADNVLISPEEIERAAQTSLPELLQQQRGVQVTTYGGSGGAASVYLRGTNNNQALVLIDGVRTESSTLGGALWSTIPVAMIDHIEIVFGPQSTFYGADALGGVIQIFTKRGDGPVQVTASTGYGTYNTTINNASVSGSTEGANKTRYAIGFFQESSSGFNTVAPNNYCSPQNAAKNGCAYPSSSTGYNREGLTGQFSKEYQLGQEVGLKLFAVRSSYKYPGYNYDNSASEINTQSDNMFVTSIYSRNQITSNWQSLLQIANSTVNGQAITSTTGDPINTPQYDFLWQNDIKLGPDTLQLLAERRMQYVSASYSASNIGFENNADVNESRTTDSVGASYQLKRGDHLGTVALRNDSISGYGSQTTWSAAYGYMLTKELRANINYGTGFRAPTFNDLYYPGYGNPNLQPETNRNFETGLHYETKSYDLHLVGYQNKIQNLIVAMQCPERSSGYCPRNFANTEISGASLGANIRLKSWTLKGSFDLMNAVDVNTGNQLPNRAKDMANLGAEYRIGRSNIGANLTLSGMRFANASNTETNASYALMSLYASHEVNAQWTLFARWNNIFNAQYQMATGYNTPGSNVFAGVRYTYQ